MLLLLVTFVIGGLSWYVYEQTRYLLQAKEFATAELLQNKGDKLIQQYKDQFIERLVGGAERMGRQAIERTQLSPIVPILDPYYTGHLFSTLSSSLLNPNTTGNLATHVMPALSVQNWRVMLAMSAKRTIELGDRAADEGDVFQLWTPRAAVHSANMPKDCFRCETDFIRDLPLYQPYIQEEVLKCGSRYTMVTVKLPVVYEVTGTGRFFNSTMVGRTELRSPQRRESSSMPRPIYSMVVQLARLTEHRDKVLNSINEDVGRELVALQRESELLRGDMLNRLILICLATISLSALAITWVSRSSLAPLVDVADAVSDLTPKDLRLKFQGAQLDPKQLPEELAPIVQRLQESLESLDQAFSREKRATADISHELRTPIASLLTTMQVSLRKPRTEEEYRATLKQCVETGTHMKTLVERLLQLSRLDAGVDVAKHDPVDVVELAGQCVDMIRPLADQRQITIELEVDDSASNLDPVAADAAKLREILVNLIDNAVHYNKDAGQVNVKVSAAPKAVIFEVQDTGVGMTEETRSHLFERFYRADSSRQSSTINAGLGLAIVKGYVDLFGGSISVSSTYGEGSTFRITLPRQAAPVKVIETASV
jgi:signal transduction histidine kinase